MESNLAIQRLSALAHESRLGIFRFLVRKGPEGVPAGEIAKALKIAPNTLSSHLNLLTGAGLTQSRREGRSIIYSAHFSGMSELMLYLAEDCCEGRPEICAPIAQAMNELACCNEES